MNSHRPKGCVGQVFFGLLIFIWLANTNVVVAMVYNETNSVIKSLQAAIVWPLLFVSHDMVERLLILL